MINFKNDLRKNGIEIKALEDYPTGVHWQIHILDNYIPYSGYENEPGGGVAKAESFWRIYAFTDKSKWLTLLQSYYEASVKADHSSYNKPPIIQALEVISSVQAVVTVKLVTS